MLRLTAKDVMTSARAHLDDLTLEEYPDDASLTPFVNIAQAELQMKVFMNPNIDRLKSFVVVPNIAAGITDLADAFKAGGPLELLSSVISMRERQAGGQDSDFLPMCPARDLPSVTQSSLNGQYQFDGSTIKLPGANQPEDFRVYGSFEMRPIENGNSAIVPGSGMILGFWTAGRAANARAGGKKVGDPLLAEAKGYANIWMNWMIMELQDEPLRMQAFGRGLADGWW
jgi:hypothetical protein